jgi:uncharacterized membrane protein YoaK (UPF0700 family)
LSSEANRLNQVEKVVVASLMSWTGGFIDLVGFVALSGLYTAHMSGNTVAMARHIVRLQWMAALRHGWPIAMFVFGLLLGAVIYDAERRRSVKPIFSSTLGLEALLVATFIGVAAANDFRTDIPAQPEPKFLLMAALLAIAMGLQNVSVRRVGGINVYTTFVTGSLVKFAEALSDYLFWFRDRTRYRFAGRLARVIKVSPRQQSLQHAALTILLWITYLIGAICSAYATMNWQLLGMFAPLAVLIGIVGYGVYRPYFEQPRDEW